MPFLQTEVIAAYASEAGFTESELPVAVAIAMAESGQHSEAHNNKGKDDSYGLWQINMLGAMGPNRRKQFGIANNKQLLDPMINARAARMLKRARGNWKDWSTYNDGKYKQHLPAAQRAVALMHKKGAKWQKDVTKNHAQFGNEEVSGDGTQNPVGEGGDGTTNDNGLFGIKGAVENATNAITDTLFRIGIHVGAISLAFILLILAVVILTKVTPKKIVNATPIGKVGKVVGK